MDSFSRILILLFDNGNIEKCTLSSAYSDLNLTIYYEEAPELQNNTKREESV